MVWGAGKFVVKTARVYRVKDRAELIKCCMFCAHKVENRQSIKCIYTRQTLAQYRPERCKDYLHIALFLLLNPFMASLGLLPSCIVSIWLLKNPNKS